MTSTRKFIQAVLSLIMILSMMLSLTQTQSAAAQGTDDGIRRQTNAETGKVSFLVPAAGQSSVSRNTWGFALGPAPADPGMALAKQFAPEFGVENPERDLKVMKTNEQENGRVTVRYQQNYQGIPVIGGELIVNTNKNGDLYSMNGEIAQDVAIDIQPDIPAEKAVEIAKQAMAEWYGGTEADYRQTDPALWIFDEQLLQPSTRPIELVWRLDMTPIQQGRPVRELVLVNAKDGNVSLHFNQIDTEWVNTQAQDPTPTEPPTEPPTVTPVPTDEVTPTETPVPTQETLPTEPPTQTATPLSSTPTETAEPTEPGKDLSGMLPDGDVKAAFTGTVRYVAPTGNNSNTCQSSGSPCATIQGAIDKSINGDIVKVAQGTYYYTSNATPSAVIINRGVLLSGGWDSGFLSQTGVSIIDGQNTNNGIQVNISTAAAAVDRFVIQNSRSTDGGAIIHMGTSLTLTNSTLKNNTATNRGAGIICGTAEC